MDGNGYAPQPQRQRRSQRYATPDVQATPRQASSAAWQAGYTPQQTPQPPSQGVPVMNVAQPQQAYQPQGYPQQGYQQPYQAGAYPQQGYQPHQQPAPQNTWAGQNSYGGDFRRRGYVPTQPTQPAEGGSGHGGDGPRAGLSLGKLMAILAVAAAVVLAVVLGLQSAGDAREEQQLREYVESYNNVYCMNVYVDGIHLGGMTQQEALSAVTQQAQKRNDAWSVTLTFQGQVVTVINASHLGMTVDVMEPLRLAWAQGHTGSIKQRAAAMEQLNNEAYQGYTALPGGDTSVIDTLLADISNRIYRAPQDAALVAFEPEKTSNPFTIQEEAVGYSLNTAPIKEQLYRMVSTLESGTIEIVPDVIQPAITTAEIRKLVTLRGSASTKISSKSTEDRTENIRVAFQRCNGYVIMPGNTFSFNNVVGERSLKNGFREAIEYAYNEEVMGVGGGVCQASSTLYQAAVNAGLEIVKREPHSKEVNYTEYGLDATVLWSSYKKIDLVFRNNTEHPIYLVTRVQSTAENRKKFECAVDIYGYDLGNEQFRLEASTVEIIQPPEEPDRRKDKKGEYVTYVDEEKQVSAAKEGYVVDSYMVRYVDGQEVDRKFLYRDTYKARPAVVYVGIKQRED